MKERPILFITEMVRAILDGRKTQTRRVMKKVSRMEDADWSKNHKVKDWWPCNIVRSMVHIEDMLKDQSMSRCLNPYGEPGDRLWVREAWLRDIYDHSIQYRASHPSPMGAKWKPSIHMPREHCRITLEITDVKVERLQEICNLDIWREGILPTPKAPGVSHEECREADFQCFKESWDSINDKKHPWESNPWVWVIAFRRMS